MLSLQKQWDKAYNCYKGKRISVWDNKADQFFVSKIKYFKSKKIKEVLDAGCGDGRNLLPFIKAGFNVTGVDVSNAGLDKCKKLYGKLSNLRLEKKLLEKLNYKSNSFDLIICDHVLVHTKNVKKILNNFYKILKIKGYALLEFTSTNDPLFGRGKKINKYEYSCDGVYCRFFDVPLIKELLKKFEILSIYFRVFTQPNHGSGYFRKKRHTHCSYFVLAQKIK